MRGRIMAILGAVLLSGCMDNGQDYRPNPNWRHYDYNRPDPAYGGYQADRYYREDTRYRERRLTRNDRIYRGTDGRYYCRRSDGTTGLVVGAISGAVLGNVIARGDSRLLGTLLGATAGALLGQQVDRGEVRCR